MKGIGLGLISLMLLAFTNTLTASSAAAASKPAKPRLTGNVYYVARNGSDSNPGTETEPWLTMNKAAAVLVAGETAYVKNGTYAPIASFANSGVKGNLITFRAYPGHNVKIELGGNNLVVNKNYIRIEGFKIAGGGMVYLRGATGCELVSNYIHNASTSGVYVSKGGKNIIKSNDIAFHKASGMYVGYRSNYNKVLENKIHDNGGNGLNIKASANYNLVEKNEIYKNENEDGINIYGSAKEGYSTTEHNIVRFNVIHDHASKNPKAHVDGIQLFHGAHNNLFYSNLIYNIKHQPFLIGSRGRFCNGNIVEGNIIWNPPDRAPYNKYGHCIFGTSKGSKFIHNTIYGGVQLIINKDAAAFAMKDNIIARVTVYRRKAAIHRHQTEQSLSADYDLVYSNSGLIADRAKGYRTVAEWRAAEGYEKHGKDGNPLFVDPDKMDLRLKPTSPAKKAASDGKDMGAYFPNMFIATLIRVSDMRGAGVTITWETTKSADSTVEYGKTTAYGKSVHDRALRTSHSIKLAKLGQGEYHYRVKSKDATGYKTASSDYTFYVFPSKKSRP